jgi:hypothetical protein
MKMSKEFISTVKEILDKEPVANNMKTYRKAYKDGKLGVLAMINLVEKNTDKEVNISL